jgi:hypothetical protein
VTSASRFPAPDLTPQHLLGLSSICRCGTVQLGDAEWGLPSGLRLSRFQRKHEPEHCAYSAWLLTSEISAVRPGKTARDRQPEAGAAGISCPTMIKAYQPLEDPFSL